MDLLCYDVMLGNVMTSFWLYITDHGNFGVAHALYHVTLSQGVQNNHSYEIFDPLFAYSLCHFYAYND